MLEKRKHPGGRPPLFKTESELNKLIENYFKECKDHRETYITKQGKVIEDLNIPQNPTIAGLAYALGIDRGTIYNYEKTEQFFNTIIRARDYIIQNFESKAANTDGNISGTLFLMQNYGYKTNSENKQIVNIDEETKQKLKDIFDGFGKGKKD